LDAIEQLSFLLFLKRLDEKEEEAERRAKREGRKFEPTLEKKLRWSYWTQLAAEAALKHVKEKVFRLFALLGG
jgi:type I restriction enzyme M protein